MIRVWLAEWNLDIAGTFLNSLNKWMTSFLKNYLSTGVN